MLNKAPVVTVVDNAVTTLSTDVAEFFEKRHSNVVRDIETIISTLPDDRLLNFEQTVVTRVNPSGGAQIKSKAYRLTRDGFTFLAMGFTGAKAQQFKWAYIDAFNKMEQTLAREKLPHSARLDECNDYPLTEAQLVYIREFVKKHIPQGYRTRAYSELRRTFNVRRSAFIKIKNFDDAISVLSAFAKRVPMLPPPKKHQRKTAQTLAMPKNIAPFRVLISFDECNKPYVQILGHKLLIDANNLEHLKVLVGQTVPVQYLAEVMQVCADRLARRI